MYKRELVPVDVPIVGQLYHVSWGRSHGVVGKCIEIRGDKVILMSPSTKKLFKYPIPISQLRHTRKNQAKLLNI